MKGLHTVYPVLSSNLSRRSSPSTPLAFLPTGIHDLSGSINMDSTSPEEQIPLPGQWPVDPQEDVPISEDRLWVDGCFDFSHHGKSRVLPLIQSLEADRSQSTGHAGAMLQARQLGKELYVGIHSDQAILENKGPTVMSLEERSVCIVLFHTLVYN